MSRSSKQAIALYIIWAVHFGLFAYMAWRQNFFPGDDDIAQWLQGIDSSFFDWLMRAVSSIEGTAVAIVSVTAVVLLLFILRKRREAGFVAGVMLVAEGFTRLFKFLIDRPRPGDDVLAGGFSFPSGHVTYAVVFFGFMVYLMPRLVKQKALAVTLQVILSLIIFLTGFSRVYLGEHWPSDALGGYLLGGLLLALGITLFQHATGKKEINAGTA